MTSTDFKKAASAARVDYFALFGMEERFALDAGALEREYLQRSKDVHPDRFVNAPANERVSALQQSMLLNDAYKTLKRPLPRAEYLLQRHGVTIGDNERLDPVFLMDVLEAREELAEAKHRGDKTALRRLEEDMLDRLDSALAKVATLFKRYECERDASALTAIKSQVILLRYVRRYLDEFEDIFDEEDES